MTTTKTESPKFDIYQHVTDQIIGMLETAKSSGELWQSFGAKGMPSNGATGYVYKGINTFYLWAVGYDRGFQSSKWASYKDWQGKGRQVKAGEKSVARVVYWGKADKKDATGEKTGDTYLFAQSTAVFNESQLVDYVAPVINNIPDSLKIPAAEQFFSNLGGNVVYGGNSAHYTPSTDTITMPVFGAFRDQLTYYSVLGHEYTHWTSAKTRCDRQLGKRFGDRAYCAEELIAELGAAFLLGNLGLTTEPREDHAHYLAAYLKMLREDKKAIFAVAGKAQQACDYLLNNSMAHKAVNEDRERLAA